MKSILWLTAFLCAPCLCTISANAAEPDGLTLPPGFHATVVNAGIGAHARHMALDGRGDIYVSTVDFAAFTNPKAPPTGIIVLHQDAQQKMVPVGHFSTVENGTGIASYKGSLYAASPTSIYRFNFKGGELIPSAPPEVIVSGMPLGGSPNHAFAFDGKGDLFVSVPGASNNCEAKDTGNPKPTGLNPCPELKTRAGIWRFDADKTGQTFPADGEQVATGVRDMVAMAWAKELNGLYAGMQGRNAVAHALNPSLPVATTDDVVADELFHVTPGADLGWPYTYYDVKQGMRVLAPEYGGNGRMVAGSKYTVPVAAFPAHSSPVDLAFYDGRQFPARYRGGAFVVLHGGMGPDIANGHAGYQVDFVPFHKSGKAGVPEPFMEGFAGPEPSSRNVSKAIYRPMGVAVAKDGSLYIIDSNKGRIWRVTYGTN
jgi:glucose/arabinose dehydrogenase